MSPKGKIPVCECGAPLICTFVFDKHEFYCIVCGRKYEWLKPEMVWETPDLESRRRALEEEFSAVAAAIIVRGSILKTCSMCTVDEEHAAHATEEEWAAHEAALEYLAQRTELVGA